MFQTREEAIARERYFKSASGRRFLAKKVREIDAGSLPD
jgi:hypothetical protein